MIVLNQDEKGHFAFENGLGSGAQHLMLTPTWTSYGSVMKPLRAVNAAGLPSFIDTQCVPKLNTHTGLEQQRASSANKFAGGIKQNFAVPVHLFGATSHSFR